MKHTSVVPAKYSLASRLIPLVARILAWFCLSTLAMAHAQTTTAPATNSSGDLMHQTWSLSGLPKGNTPLSQFDWKVIDDQAALALRTQSSYGVLTHIWRGMPPTELSWRWRLDQGLPQADIQTKEGDDAALKVCVMFDQPLADIPFFQRTALGVARSVSGKNLPSATLCYLWDTRYPAGTAGQNPYSARVRFIVVTGASAPFGQWVTLRRRIADDFAMLFGNETRQLPPVTAIAIGADSDNTQGRSLGYLANLTASP